MVFTADGWFLIDSEYAAAHGSPLPEQLERRDPSADKCNAATDLYLVYRLIEDKALLLDEEGKQFMAVVRDKRMEFSADRLLGAAWLRVPVVRLL